MITPKTHPIKFLLQFEWVLLALTFLLELPRLPFGPARSPLLSMLLIGCFGALGLYLPNKAPKLKGLHLGASFAILLLAAFVAKIRLIALLCIVLVVRTCFMLQTVPRIFLTISIIGFAMIQQIDRLQSFQAARVAVRGLAPAAPLRGFREDRTIINAISSSILLGLVLVFLQLMINAILSERQSREQLQDANDQLRRYALRVEDVATLQERNRIAREIHDSLGHSLTAFNLHVEAALRLFQSDPEEAQALLVEAKQLGSNALREVRQSVGTLRSNPLQGKTLRAAMQQLLEDFSRSTGIQPEKQFYGLESLSDDQAVALYRIVQEALTNIAKYAQANAVSIRLEHNQQQTLLKIKDDGRGFDMSQNRSGFGLQGMQERTQAIGGRYSLTSTPGKGCSITVHIP
jgi:signal transduction histidine kinase